MAAKKRIKYLKVNFYHWRRKWQPTPLPLPGKSHGQRSLVGYIPWSQEESDTTERLHFTCLITFPILKVICLPDSIYFIWYLKLQLYKTFRMWSSTLSLTHAHTSAQSLRSCPTLFNPMDCSLPSSSVHGILQARTLEWVAMPSSRSKHILTHKIL